MAEKLPVLINSDEGLRFMAKPSLFRYNPKHKKWSVNEQRACLS
jgi:hypothetical protein